MTAGTNGSNQEQERELRGGFNLDISVIIASWNARQFLEECLKSLVEAPMKHNMEIIVVDNASTDGSPEMVATRFPQVKLIRNKDNLGFAKANNVGIRESKGRYVSLINSDVKILGDCLGALADFMDEHQDVGNVGPRILNADMTLQSSCRRFPTLWNSFCEASGLARPLRASKFFSGQHMSYFPHDRVLDVDVLVGCFWVMRREALDAVGLLDEAFFIYSEDVDWCTRCWRTGWRIVFAPVGQAIHYCAGSSTNDPLRFAVEQQRAVLHYWSKYRGLLGRCGIRAIIFFRHLSRYLFGIASRCVRSSTTEHDSRVVVSAACIKALVSRGTGQEALALPDLKSNVHLPDLIRRFFTYHDRHGFRETAKRAAIAFHRFLSANRTVLFYCDLRKEEFSSGIRNWPSHLSVEQKHGESEVEKDDILTIVNFVVPAISRRQLMERFRQGASLWLARSEGNLAGYGWTITGRTVKPHFYSLGENDVHLFDFLVFPEYRGRQINPLLVTYILQQLAADSRSRAYIEVAEWNHAQLSSLRKTGFLPMGLARKASLFGRTFVEWSGPLQQAQYKSAHNDRKIASGTLASH